ncbi:hypothetical protein BJ165DRAFT_343084 [Panaeolus papilionaceus]|nr:hypothetical protein BJ165DRAFT_343084 [Panaeolus papilionaceus]
MTAQRKLAMLGFIAVLAPSIIPAQAATKRGRDPGSRAGLNDDHDKAMPYYGPHNLGPGAKMHPQHSSTRGSSRGSRSTGGLAHGPEKRRSRDGSTITAVGLDFSARPGRENFVSRRRF